MRSRLIDADNFPDLEMSQNAQQWSAPNDGHHEG
jgi:hypothetical protein